MTAAVVAGLAATVGVGLTLGLVGAGGSILVVPILVYGMGLSPHAAIGVSLAVVASTSALGAVLQHRQGNVHVRTGAMFAALGIAGSFIGSKLTFLLSERALMLSFAGLTMMAAIVMFAWKDGSRPRPEQPRVAAAMAAGLATGLLTGFLGVGGGFVVVPALMLFAGLPARLSMGTSLAVIAANSVVAFLSHLSSSAFDVSIAAAVAAAAAAGMVAGARVSRRLSPTLLRKGFAVVAVAAALLVLGENAF